MKRKTKCGMKPMPYPDTMFNASQLRYGTSVEMEHTTNRQVAENIAKQHLVEGGNYYKLLKKMETKLKKLDKFKKVNHVKPYKAGRR